MWEGSNWLAHTVSHVLGLKSDQVCCGLETADGRQGKERSETVLLAESCQWALGEEACLISAVVGV